MPVQEVIFEETAEEESISAPASEEKGWMCDKQRTTNKAAVIPENYYKSFMVIVEVARGFLCTKCVYCFIFKGDDEFQSAAYGSPTPSSPRQPGSLRHIDSNAATLTEASSSAGSPLDIKTPGWSPERRSPLLIGSPEKKLPGESSTTLYFSADAQSPSSGSYLGWGSELSPISSYRSPYRIREARFVTSTPRLEPRSESPGPAPVVVIPATPGTTPGTTPGGTPAASTPAASTSAASTPAASTPGASTPGATTPSTPVIPLTPVISHARKQMVQFVDTKERAV